MRIEDFNIGMIVYNKDNQKLTVEAISAAKNCDPIVYTRNNTGFAWWYKPNELFDAPSELADLGLSKCKDMKKCRYCDKDTLNNIIEVNSKTAFNIKIAICADAIVCMYTDNLNRIGSKSVPINYCPMCGRKLK